MANYALIYKSYEASDWTKLPEAEKRQTLQAWQNWSSNIVGAARKAGGAFKFGGKSVAKDDIQDADNLPTGVAIIEAENLDEALNIAQQAPSVQMGIGTLEVYEILSFE